MRAVLLHRGAFHTLNLNPNLTPTRRTEIKSMSRKRKKSAGKPDALQTLREFVRLACFVAKRLECVRLAGAFALPRDYRPKRSFHFATTLAAAILLLSSTAFAQLDRVLPRSEQAEAGQALAEKWRDAVPPENAEYKGALKIRATNGHTETIPLTFRIVTGATNWQTVYEAVATVKTPTQKLTIIHTPGQPNQYLFVDGANGQPVRLTTDQTAVPFAGSDFWLSDLGLEFFHWPTQRLIKTEMRKGQVTKVLESVNPQPTGYARVVTWLDKESGAPILAEAYGRNDKLLKEFSIKSVRKVKGQYQLQEMQIRNAQTNSRTRIEYGFEKD